MNWTAYDAPKSLYTRKFNNFLHVIDRLKDTQAWGVVEGEFCLTNHENRHFGIFPIYNTTGFFFQAKIWIGIDFIQRSKDTRTKNEYATAEKFLVSVYMLLNILL